MFSHLCRCCLSEFSSSTDIVPLFEPYKNIWYHRLITATFRLSLTKNDSLSTNICKRCAVEILKSYKFRLKYIESERKLRSMVDRSEETSRYENLYGVEVTVNESATDSQTQILSDTADLRWKCNTCSAGFASRSQYREHRRLHSKKITSGTDNSTEPASTIKKVKQNRWKCDYCPAEFGTSKLKLMHEADEHSENVSFSEPAILIEDDGSVNNGFIASVKAEVNIDTDPNEFRFIDQEPEVDLGLYLIEKHSQINSLDPLDINNYNDSLLVPLNATINSPETINTSDSNVKWKCPYCPEAFRTRDQLREHNHIHMALKRRPKPVVVKVEKVKVVKVQNVTNVKPSMSESNAAKWQCKTCMSSFATRDLLRIHRRAYVAARNEKTRLKEGQCVTEKPVDDYEPKKLKIEVIDE